MSREDRLGAYCRRRPPKEAGPHEGREIDLMPAGTKPLALAIDDGPGSGLVP